MGSGARGLRFVLVLSRDVLESDIKYPAAAIAYYTFVATLPVLLLVFAVLGERMTGDVTTITADFLTPETQVLVQESLTTATGRTGASILAIVVFVWASINIVDGFRSGLTRIDEEYGNRSRILQIRDGVFVLVSIALGILAIAVASALPILFPYVPYISPIAEVSLLIVLTAVFLPLYVVSTSYTQTVRHAVPGAVVAAVGWTLLQLVLRFHAENAGRYALYGVLSGVILFVTSLYLGALVLMIGAMVNSLLADP